MNNADFAISTYESARSELIERLRLRDQVLLAYLAAVGALFALAFKTEGDVAVLLVLPFLALGAGIIVSQHNDVIGSLSAFCGIEWSRHVKALGADPPQWDSSKQLYRLSELAFSKRHAGANLLLIGSCALSITTSLWDLFFVRPGLCFTAWCGPLDVAAATLFSLALLGTLSTFWLSYLLSQSNAWRKTLRDEIASSSIETHDRAMRMRRRKARKRSTQATDVVVEKSGHS